MNPMGFDEDFWRWLTAVARNAHRDMVRKQGRYRSMLSRFSDWLLSDDLHSLKNLSFKKSLRVAKHRRIKRHALACAPLVLLITGWLAVQVTQISKRAPEKVISNVMHGVKSPVAIEKTSELAPKIQILTDSEFEEMIQGYPMAIIHRDGQTLYLPLEP